MDTIECGVTTPTEHQPAKGRSRLSNSIFTYPGNGKSKAGRRFRDLVAGMLEDLGVTEAQLPNTVKLQIQHAALLAVDIEQAKAGAVSVVRDELIRMEGRLDMKLWQLGLAKRRRPDLGPTEDPLDYAASFKAGAK